MLTIKKFVVNPLQENSFVLYDETKECIIIDAGFYYDDEKTEIDTFIVENQLIVTKLVNTHCHFDHIMGIEYLRGKYKVPFFAHKEDSFWIEKAVEQGEMFNIPMNPVSPIDTYIDENNLVEFGNSSLRVIHVPGHSPGHIVFYSEENSKLIAGDVLFYGSIGRADLPGGDYNTLVSAIKSKVLVLPTDTKVYCGHGPETTIGFEKANNPFLN